MTLLNIGDRIVFDWNNFNLYTGYYPECVRRLKNEYPKNKRYYITEVRPHRYFEYLNDYKINNKIWVCKETVSFKSNSIIDKIIFNIKFKSA